MSMHASATLTTASILDVVARRRGDRHRISETMGRVGAAYITSTRDRMLREEFEQFLDFVLAAPNGRRSDGGCLFVTGESGAGKTHAIRHLLRKTEALQPIEVDGLTFDPCVSIKAPSPCTLQRLGLELCEAIGYPIKIDTAENRVWTALIQQFRVRQILVVHIDEAQHLVRTMKSETERQAVANTLKAVLQKEDWPVSFILSGIPIANRIASSDTQIERRSRFFALPSLDMDRASDRRLVEYVVKVLASERADLDCERLLQDDIAARLSHAANDQLGRVAQIVTAAIHKALLRARGELTLEDFVNAYRSHSHARGIDELNPFIIANWHALQKGSFIVTEANDG